MSPVLTPSPGVEYYLARRGAQESQIKGQRKEGIVSTIQMKKMRVRESREPPDRVLTTCLPMKH